MQPPRLKPGLHDPESSTVTLGQRVSKKILKNAHKSSSQNLFLGSATLLFMAGGTLKSFLLTRPCSLHFIILFYTRQQKYLPLTPLNFWFMRLYVRLIQWKHILKGPIEVGNTLEHDFQPFERPPCLENTARNIKIVQVCRWLTRLLSIQKLIAS